MFSLSKSWFGAQPRRCSKCSSGVPNKKQNLLCSVQRAKEPLDKLQVLLLLLRKRAAQHLLSKGATVFIGLLQDMLWWIFSSTRKRTNCWYRVYLYKYIICAKSKKSHSDSVISPRVDPPMHINASAKDGKKPQISRCSSFRLSQKGFKWWKLSCVSRVLTANLMQRELWGSKDSMNFETSS